MNTRNRKQVDQGWRRGGFAWKSVRAMALGALFVGTGGCATVNYVSAPRDAADALVCEACAGKGKVEVKCPVCGGQGYTTTSVPGLYGPSYTTVPCRTCLKAEALGTKEVRDCPRCKATGRVYRCDSSGKRLPAEAK